MDRLETYNLISNILDSYEELYQTFLDEEGWNDTPVARVAFYNSALDMIDEDKESLDVDVYVLLKMKFEELKQSYFERAVEDVMTYIKRPVE